jgi:phasin protein
MELVKGGARSRPMSARKTEGDMTPSQFGNVTEENNPMDPIEQAARASEKTAKEFAEGASRVKDAAARASDRAMRASVEIMQRNAETVQHTLEYGAKLAARMTERSADQFGRAIGFSGEGAAQRSSRDLEAIVQSGTVLTELTQRLCEEWVEIARARMDRGFGRIDALLQCRTPQDFAALQSELMRDNLETFLGYARKVGEHSARLADEARQRFGTVAEGRRAA